MEYQAKTQVLFQANPQAKHYPIELPSRANGVFYPTSIVVNDTMDVDIISGQSCGTLLAVAVGGGGTTSNDAGSGSGYVEYVEISPPPPLGNFGPRLVEHKKQQC